MNVYALGIIERAGKLLFLLRKNSLFFSDYYGLVGGKLEPHETIVDSLIREVFEEVGIIVSKNDVRFAHCLSFKNEKGVELAALVFKINHWQGEFVNKEPDKHAELAWFSLDELPENIVPRHRQVVEMVRKGIFYSEDGW